MFFFPTTAKENSKKPQKFPGKCFKHILRPGRGKLSSILLWTENMFSLSKAMEKIIPCPLNHLMKVLSSDILQGAGIGNGNTNW